MMRLARVASMLACCLLSKTAVTEAQPAAAARPADFYVDLTFVATLGHKSSSSIGAEGGFKIMDKLEVFVEGGHMKNVGTQDLDNRAARIANAVGATFSAAYKVNYFDAGVRYHLPVTPMINSYLAFGVGLAQVGSETALSVNGTTVPPESLGVQFGNDLNGTVKKPLITFGGGVILPFARRYFADISYRYGRILAKTGEIENDTGINTSRIQIGVGITF
jgi:opacity protein-like surface antigen